MLSRRTVLGGILLAAQSAAQMSEADAIAAGRKLAESFLQRNMPAVAAGVAPALQAKLPVDTLNGIADSLKQQVGDYSAPAGASWTENAGGNRVVVTPAQFSKGILNVRITLNPQGQMIGLFFAPGAPMAAAGGYQDPAYVKPQSFEERDVTVGTGEWKLPGTLTMPKGRGPFPALLLVHGSGPNDRDESIGPNKAFRDIANGLASQGIAVLRYDKRTKVYGPKMASSGKATVRDEVIDDALSGLALLRQTAGVDPKRIFLLGHSLGGMLTPQIASESPGLAGIILMAGATRTLPEMMIEQLDYLGTLPDNQSAPAQERIAQLKKQAQAAASPGLSVMTPPSSLPPGATAAYLLELRDYSPTSTIKKVKAPILILQGGRDYNVTAKDLANWQTATKGRTDVTIKEYPKGNHYLYEGEGKATPSELSKLSHVPEYVVSDIATWIKAQH